MNMATEESDGMSLVAATEADPHILLGLAAQLATHEVVRAAALAVRARGTITLEGAAGGGVALTIAALLKVLGVPALIICPSSDCLDRLEDELPLFTDRPFHYFPAWEVACPQRTPADATFGTRLRALRSLLDGRTPSIVTHIAAVLQPVPSRLNVETQRWRLAVGEDIHPEEFRRWLVENGYQQTTSVALPGEFSCRGGIWDVFAVDAELPVRIEWLDDQIESLRHFDVATQRSTQAITQYEILAAASGTGSANAAPGERLCSLIEYLPPDSVILVVEPERVRQEAALFQERRAGEEPLHRIDAIFAAMGRFGMVEIAALAPTAGGLAMRLPLQTAERFSGEVGRTAEELDRAASDQQLVLVVQTEAEKQRLQELFQQTAVQQQQRLTFVIGTLHQGFRFETAQTIVLSGADLFHRRSLARRPSRPVASQPLDRFLELQEGDLVVHLSHGIGRYRGMELICHKDRAEEHLVIEFADNVRICVPATRLYLVHKYVGGTRKRPALARLGSKSWVRQKQSAQQAVLDIAAEMLQLQAQRLAHPGHACGADSLWQHEFDAAFPYQETADQLAAMAAIKKDMESPRPMDRLLCGDVGFGKTELAMRAAFKAVDNGYQVAVLAPTTVLVEQHYRTFCERMAEFPITIAKLSRFCSGRQQREVIEGLVNGRVDIVIGTHRLASRDVQFRNLGLVIIDEEQRFGVHIKEHLKRLRASVDVLTLSATPIPRTLHMALVGARDICNLETPPADRQAVETRIIRWNNEVIRQAVLRELSRHGQIYFIHNRIEDIDVVARKLRMIVPEARLRIAHARLPEDELEQVMLDFVDHRFDLLLATTIVENGLDIPNANTMFIDEADHYGLADLHQLRGRIGRYKHKAYCYLLLDPRKPISPNASRRLLAIEEFSQLGAGFAIAMRDLEIRGAGNLLGTEQSGHIAAIGYELYCQLLENAVRSLQQLPPKSIWDVDIRLPIQAYLPAEYVSDIRSRIDLYRRLARMETGDELAALQSELLDRFGPWPPMVEGLFQLARLRQLAAHWRLRAIYTEDECLVLRYTDRNAAALLARRTATQARFVGEESLYIPLSSMPTYTDGLATSVEALLRP